MIDGCYIKREAIIWIAFCPESYTVHTIFLAICGQLLVNAMLFTILKKFAAKWMSRVRYFESAGLILGLHPANERRPIQRNTVSHWLGANLETALVCIRELHNWRWPASRSCCRSPADTLRNNDVVITSKLCHFDVVLTYNDSNTPSFFMGGHLSDGKKDYVVTIASTTHTRHVNG